MSGLQADEVIAIRLTAAQWNQALVLMGEAPYRVSAPLIQTIQQQCQVHEMRHRQASQQLSMPRLVPEDYGAIDQPNGAA
jgi:hypothetical protein